MVGTNNCNNGFGFGNGWEGIIGLLVVAGLFGGGWGNGFGFGGNRGSNCATQADLSAGFANSEIMSDLNDIILGQASMQNFINQGFAGLNNTITTGFAGVNNAVCTLGYQNQAGFNAISREIADCCCTTQRNIDSLRYDMSKGFCDVVRAGQDNTRAILDYLTTEKISSLQSENAGLKAQISNDRQSAYLLSELKECPKAAYIVPNPNCCYNYGVYPVNSGCGASVL
jgi:hypothetical protein